MIEITEDDIDKIADSSTIVQRGKSYFRSGRIKSINIKEDRITAKVLGNYGNYNIEITVDQKRNFETSCNCPYDGSGCKHIAAVMYYVYHQQKDDSSKKMQQQKSTLFHSQLPSKKKLTGTTSLLKELLKMLPSKK